MGELFIHGLRLALPVIEGNGPPIEAYGSEQRDAWLRRLAIEVLRILDYDHDRLEAATEGCIVRRIARETRGVPTALDGYAGGVAMAEGALALLHQRGAEAPGPSRDALRNELEALKDAPSELYLEGLWRRPRLRQRLAGRLQTWSSPRGGRRVVAWGWLEHHGPEYPADVERIRIHLGHKNSKPSEPTDEVRVHYRVCHPCRRVFLGKVAVNNDSMRRLGLGSHAIQPWWPAYPAIRGTPAPNTPTRWAIGG